MNQHDYITLMSLVFIAASNLFSMLQNIQLFRAASVERKKINLGIRSLIEALEKIEG